MQERPCPIPELGRGFPYETVTDVETLYTASLQGRPGAMVMLRRPSGLAYRYRAWGGVDDESSQPARAWSKSGPLVLWGGSALRGALSLVTPEGQPLVGGGLYEEACPLSRSTRYFPLL